MLGELEVLAASSDYESRELLLLLLEQRRDLTAKLADPELSPLMTELCKALVANITDALQQFQTSGLLEG